MTVYFVHAYGLVDPIKIRGWYEEVANNFFENGVKKIIICCQLKPHREKIRELLRPNKDMQVWKITRINNDLHVDELRDETLDEKVRLIKKRRVSHFRPKKNVL